MANGDYAAVVFFNLFVTFTNASFELTILHTSCLNSRMYEINSKKHICEEKDRKAKQCFGGMARISTKVKELKAIKKHTILLDAGDMIDEGTVLFDFFKGKAEARLMNEVGYDAVLLGHSEFKAGEQVINAMLENSSFGVVISNAHVEGLLGHVRIHESYVINFPNKETVGLVGYLPASVGQTLDADFVNFERSLKKVQAEVEELKSKGVNKIICLGNDIFEASEVFASKLKDVDILIGGDDARFLYTGTPPSIETAKHPYPYVKKSADGNKVLILSSWQFGKYLGQLDVTFDDAGLVESYSGNPILLDHSVKKDPGIEAIIDTYLPEIDKYMHSQLANTLVDFPKIRNTCTKQECNYGNLLTDACVDAVLKVMEGDPGKIAPIGIYNGGGMHGSFSIEHPITIADFFGNWRHKNPLYIVELSGLILKDMLEHSASGYGTPQNNRFLQVSGLWVTYNGSQPINNRVVTIDVRGFEKSYPARLPWSSHKIYRVVMPDWLAKGGDEFRMIKDIPDEKKQRLHVNDMEVLREYIKRKSPLTQGVEGRIRFLPENGLCTGARLVCLSSSRLFVLPLFHALLRIQCF